MLTQVSMQMSPPDVDNFKTELMLGPHIKSSHSVDRPKPPDTDTRYLIRTLSLSGK